MSKIEINKVMDMKEQKFGLPGSRMVCEGMAPLSPQAWNQGGTNQGAGVDNGLHITHVWIDECKQISDVSRDVDKNGAHGKTLDFLWY